MCQFFSENYYFIWKIRFLKRDRLTDDSIKKKLQLGWGFNRFFDRYVAQSKLLSGRTLQDGFEVLYEADLALKTSFALFPGRRKFYKESLIRFTLPTPFVEKVDTYIKEIETNVGEDGQDLSVLDSQPKSS